MSTVVPGRFVGEMFFEETLRRFLAYSFKEIQRNTAAPGASIIDELFAKMGDDIRTQIKSWFVNHTNVSMVINYPKDDIKLPFIAVVNASEEEKTAETFLGDHGGSVVLGSLDQRSSQTPDSDLYGEPVRPTRIRNLVSIPERRVTRLYIASDDVNVTLYMYVVVKAICVLNKDVFDSHMGVRNLSISGADFEHRQELFPTFAYFKMLTLSYDSTFDVAIDPVDTIAGVALSFSNFITEGL